MNALDGLSTTDLKEELERREGVFYRGVFKHRKGCDSSSVNPVTEWCGGANVRIVGYECPRCGMITPQQEREQG